MGLSQVPLAERIYRTGVWMNGRLDRLITQTLAVGLNAQRFAKVARDWFNPSLPGGTRYAAMRLARTEINNAFHATSVGYAQDKPWVSQMDWNLSKSHPKPDKCNEYADLSPWDVSTVPRKPHPQCMCYVTEVTPNEDEWIDRFIAGEFDDYLDGELAKEDAKLGIRQPTQATVKLPSAVPKPLPPKIPPPHVPLRLSGDSALDSVPKGLPKPGSLTTKQRNAFKTYESAAFLGLNGFLRRRTEISDKSEARTAATIAEIDSAMDGSVLPNHVEAWRGISNADRLFGDALTGDLTGFSWEELAYSSTSTEESVAREFIVGDNGILIRVLTPAGTKAVQISESHDHNQAEILLARGTAWKVVKDHGMGPSGKRVIDVEVSTRQRVEIKKATGRDNAAA
jgi:hypothetical protein